MNNASIVIQKPVDAATSLVLLFHGVGALPSDMAYVGKRIAMQDSRALVVAVASPDPSDFGRGRQWFSVKDITETNRPERIAATMPRFEQEIAHWQREVGLASADTTLVGFSQGAIMALEATLRQPTLAALVIALAGRFAAGLNVRPGAAVHLIHGTADAVIPSRYSEQAAHRIAELGGTVSLDLVPGLGHGIDENMLRHVLRLTARSVNAPAE